MSYHDKIAKDTAKAAASKREPVTGDDPMGEIERALDATELSIAMRKMVAKAVAQRVMDDEIGSGDLVRLLGMLNDRVDGKVADKHEHSGNIGISQVLASVMGKTTGLPDPAWFDVVDNAGGLGHNLPVLDAEVVLSDTPAPTHPAPDLGEETEGLI